MPRHPALGSVIAAEARSKASIYRFNEEAALMAEKILGSHRRFIIQTQNCHAPHPTMFIEWPSGEMTGGFLTEGDRDDCKITVFYMWPSGQIRMMVQGQLDITECAVKRFKNVSILGFRKMAELDEGRAADILFVSVRWIVAAWAFIALQGSAVTVTGSLTREGRIARRRGKPFALGAIDSFNTVTLRPMHALREAELRERRGPGVRYHQVRGHLKTVTVGQQRMLRWIIAYYRGNPKLGVVIRQTNVTLRQEKTPA